MTRLLGGMATIALLAGCQSPKVYGPGDIGPSKFILGLMGQDERSSQPADTASSASPFETIAQPAENVTYAGSVPEFTSVETVALPSESTSFDTSVQTYETGALQPVYVDGQDASEADVYVVEDSATSGAYDDTAAITYLEDPSANLVDETATAYIAEPALPLETYSTEPSQTEITYTTADPIAEFVPVPTASTPFVEEPVVNAALPAQPALIETPSEALEIEVAVPTNLDEIAPPPILEADLIPPVTIEEAPLDAPVLPSTGILASELAPPVSESAAPQRPAFTPIPQPGLAGYGTAF